MIMDLILPEYVIDKMTEKGLDVDISQWGVRTSESDTVFIFSNTLSNKRYELHGFKKNARTFVLKDLKVRSL